MRAGRSRAGGRPIPRAGTCVGGRGAHPPGPMLFALPQAHPRRRWHRWQRHGRHSGHVRLRSDGPAQSGWCGPDQGARPGLPQTPGGRALHPVIVAASTGNIAGTGQAALIVGDRVIKVAPRRRPAADREPAVLVTHLDQVPHPVGDPVSGGGVRVGARDAGTAVRVIGVRVIANPVIAVRGANLAGRRRGSRQDGPQRGQPAQPTRSSQPG